MIKRNLTLTHYIFLRLILGAAAGRLVGAPLVPYAEFLAEIFLRLLRMVIMPLIITSIISGALSAGDAVGLGRLGIKTLVYYLGSSLFAIITELILVNIFRPGVNATIALEETPEDVPAAEQSLQDLLLHLIPENLFQAMASGDVLPIIFFCVLLGFFITRLSPSPRKRLTDFFRRRLKR